jgi:hypothetical protein
MALPGDRTSGQCYSRPILPRAANGQRRIPPATMGKRPMKISVAKPTDQQIAEMRSCPTWTKEKSTFDWEYDDTETCYLLDGQVRVTTDQGEVVEFGAGDLVTFPKGLKCVWEVRQPVRKHYRFG